MKSTCFLGLVPLAASWVLSAPTPSLNAGIEQIQLGSSLPLMQMPGLQVVPEGSYLSHQAGPESVTMTIEKLQPQHQGKIVIIQERMIPIEEQEESSSEGKNDSDTITLIKRGQCMGCGNVIEEGPYSKKQQKQWAKETKAKDEEGIWIDESGHPRAATSDRVANMSANEKARMIKPGKVRKDVFIKEEGSSSRT